MSNVEDFPVCGREGYVYVICFSTGVVKIGRSSEIERRLETHRRDAIARGIRVVHVWASPLHAGAAENERKLIRFAEGRFSRPEAGRECFPHADWIAIVDYAKGLRYRRLTPEEVATHAEDREKRFEALTQAMTSSLRSKEADQNADQLRALHDLWTLADSILELANPDEEIDAALLRELAFEAPVCRPAPRAGGDTRTPPEATPCHHWPWPERRFGDASGCDARSPLV